MDFVTFELGIATGTLVRRLYVHTCTAHVHVHLCMLGMAREAMGGHGLGNFWAGNYYWDMGREAIRAHMHCTCSRAPMHARKGSGGHGRPWIW